MLVYLTDKLTVTLYFCSHPATPYTTCRVGAVAILNQITRSTYHKYPELDPKPMLAHIQAQVDAWCDTQLQKRTKGIYA